MTSYIDLDYHQQAAALTRKLRSTNYSIGRKGIIKTPTNEVSGMKLDRYSPRDKEKSFRNPNLEQNLYLATPALRGEALLKTLNTSHYSTIFSPNKV